MSNRPDFSRAASDTGIPSGVLSDFSRAVGDLDSAMVAASQTQIDARAAATLLRNWVTIGERLVTIIESIADHALQSRVDTSAGRLKRQANRRAEVDRVMSHLHRIMDAEGKDTPAPS